MAGDIFLILHRGFTFTKGSKSSGTVKETPSLNPGQAHGQNKLLVLIVGPEGGLSTGISKTLSFKTANINLLHHQGIIL
jgi:16S rRNA U1498 N3-methylase RsmE